ncbi:hypothetical protein F7725_004804 [Dissostichus mawsoni]|uniref:Ras-related protein Rab n=1 Tax=Dissostichus mawsoni TaxID=36200 RepID=A0A7J5XK46_DISMA|nr:hypothetical protein F7725_004804 [Dissostichus mawsoni]
MPLSGQTLHASPIIGDITVHPTHCASSPGAVMQHERLLKVLVIGDLGVGVLPALPATIGVDFALKVLTWDQGTVLRLQLWDIAGQERYGNMTRVYYREAVGALVVFDMTRLSTFQAVLKWKGDLDSKSDQRSQGLCPKLPKMEKFSREYGFVGWYETSAKSIMKAEDEKASAGKTEPEGSVLVLPHFDYNAKEKNLSGCSGCTSIKTRDND